MSNGSILLFIMMAAIGGWALGWRKGFNDADTQTEYWFQVSQQYLQWWLEGLKKPDDKDGVPIPKDALEPTQIKVMAKAAGR